MMDAEQLLHDLELANENLELSEKQLETLRSELSEAQLREKSAWNRVKAEEEIISNLLAENEALKAENGSLERQNKIICDATEKIRATREELRDQNESKDAQIRGLVEALEESNNRIALLAGTTVLTDDKSSDQLKALYEKISKEATDQIYKNKEALATIPAVALELAKLEREVVKGSRVLHKTGNPEPFEYAIRKYEAHKAHKHETS